jgi:hypothetical protein
MMMVSAFTLAIGGSPASADRCYTANGREVRCPPDAQPAPIPGKAPVNPDPPPALLRSPSKLIPYSALAREPNKYVGMNLTFRGRVDQAIENGADVVLRISMWSNENGEWSDTIYVDYRKGSNSEPRILTNEIVEVRGDFVGIKSDTGLLGNTVLIPHIIVSTVQPAP